MPDTRSIKKRRVLSSGNSICCFNKINCKFALRDSLVELAEPANPRCELLFKLNNELRPVFFSFPECVALQD